MWVKTCFLVLLSVPTLSRAAVQFHTHADVADTLAILQELPPLLVQADNEDAQLKLEYYSSQIVRQLEDAATLPQLLQRLLLLEKFSATQPMVWEFLSRDVFELANARWQNATPTANIDFLRHNPFVFIALAQLPRAYTYVNAVLPLAAPRAAALAFFDPQQVLPVLLAIDEPLAFFSSWALLRRVLRFYDQPRSVLEDKLLRHSQQMLLQMRVTQAALLAFTAVASWQLGGKKLLPTQKLAPRLLPLLLPLYLGYLTTERLFATQREQWQQMAHYSDQVLLQLVQAR